MAGTGDRIRQQGHRIRLVQDEQVAVIAAKQGDQCRGHRYRSDPHEQTGARDRHALDFLAHRRPLGGHDEGPAVDAARSFALTERLQDPLHAAAHRRVELAKMRHAHSETLRPASSTSS